LNKTIIASGLWRIGGRSPSQELGKQNNEENYCNFFFSYFLRLMLENEKEKK